MHRHYQALQNLKNMSYNTKIILLYLLACFTFFGLNHFPLPAFAAGEPLTINAPVTLGVGYSFTAGSFVDRSDPAFKLIPAGTSFISKLGIGTTAIDSNGILQVGVGNTQALFISNATGNVGIGTTGPVAKLHIGNGTGLTEYFNDASENGVLIDTDTDVGRLTIEGNTQADIVLRDAGGATGKQIMQLYTDYGTTRFRSINDDFSAVVIDPILLMDHSTGNIGIGTTNPGTIKLKVTQNVSNYAIQADGDAYGLYANGTTFAGRFQGPVTISGNVGIGTTAPNVALDVTGSIEYTGTITDVSDARLKENFAPISKPLDKILSLKAYQFNMIGEKPTNIELGYKAQDVQQILPELVDITDPNNGYLGVNYIGIIPVITDAIKELNAKVDTQQKLIDNLQQQINDLKKK